MLAVFASVLGAGFLIMPLLEPDWRERWLRLVVVLAVVVLALAAVVAAALALGLTLAARKREGTPLPALLAALLSCALMAATGHVGGTMVHAPPEPGMEGRSKAE